MTDAFKLHTLEDADDAGRPKHDDAVRELFEYVTHLDEAPLLLLFPSPFKQLIDRGSEASLKVLKLLTDFIHGGGWIKH